MSAKIRSFFEDMIIILIIVAIIYGIYYFFFYDKEEIKEMTPMVKEEKIVKEIKKEPLTSDNIIKAKEIIQENSIEEEINETNKSDNISIVENITNEEIKIQNETEEIQETENLEIEAKKEEESVEEETKEVQEKNEGITTQLKTNIYYLRSKPNSKSKSIRKIVKNDSVVIESCDRFGWCKLLNEEAYVPKFVLKEF